MAAAGNASSKKKRSARIGRVGGRGRRQPQAPSATATASSSSGPRPSLTEAAVAARARRKAQRKQAGLVLQIAKAARRRAAPSAEPEPRPPEPGPSDYWRLRRARLKRAGLATGGPPGRDRAPPDGSAGSLPAVAVRVKSPYKNAELVAVNAHGFSSYGPVRWGRETLQLPRGIVPEGMAGPPARMAECFGSRLGLAPPPVALLALRALEGAYLERPHGPPRASALAAWATSPARRVTLNCRLSGDGDVDARFVRQKRAEGKFRNFVKPLAPGCEKEDEPRHDYQMDPAKKTCICTSDGTIVAVHLPGLFKKGDGIERLAAAIACAAVAFPFASRHSKIRDEKRDQRLLDAAREAAEAALRTGSLDAMRAKLAEVGPACKGKGADGGGGDDDDDEDDEDDDGGNVDAPLRGPRISTGYQRTKGAPVPKPVRLNAQYGDDPNQNRRLHLVNGYLAGVLEYLFPALCAVNLADAAAMAEIAFNLLQRAPYNYGFWAMQYIIPPEWKSRAHRDVNDAKESYAALVYYHPRGDCTRRLHSLRFPDLGIALELYHGDAVFVKGSSVEHQVVAYPDGDSDGRYCLVLTLGNNLKVDAEPASKIQSKRKREGGAGASSSRSGGRTKCSKTGR